MYIFYAFWLLYWFLKSIYFIFFDILYILCFQLFDLLYISKPKDITPYF